MDLAQAIRDHRLQVLAGVDAIAQPWGSALLNVPMERFPGKHCAGEVMLGETQHKKRFKPDVRNALDFDAADPIDLK